MDLEIFRKWVTIEEKSIISNGSSSTVLSSFDRPTRNSEPQTFSQKVDMNLFLNKRKHFLCDTAANSQTMQALTLMIIRTLYQTLDEEIKRANSTSTLFRDLVSLTFIAS